MGGSHCQISNNIKDGIVLLFQPFALCLWNQPVRHQITFPINNLKIILFKKWIKSTSTKVGTTHPRLPTTTTTIRRYSRQQQLASSAFGKFTTDWRKINRYIGVSLIHFASKFISLFIQSFYYIKFWWIQF